MPTLATVHASNATWDPSYTPIGVFVGGTSGIGEGIAEVFARHTKGNAHIIIGRNRPAATAILARLEKPLVPGLTASSSPATSPSSPTPNAPPPSSARASRAPTSASSPRARCPSRGSTSAFIEGLLPALRAANGAGEDARVAALHTAGRGGPVDLDDLGLVKSIGGGLQSVRKLVPQLASYRDLMAEVFAADDANAGISFTHAFPGTVDTPLRRASPSAILRAVHYVRFLLFPTLMFRVMTISECGEYQLYGLLQVRAPPGASRTGGAGEDIGLGDVGDPTWDEACAALGKHSEGVVGRVEV
ncbi:hypothetical protein B0H13DRAFT_2657623 [Mycena leptocephala]|nr:hypothetical protein B0H13DRAFT_2657623 [Mycena leptocephala]